MYQALLVPMDAGSTILIVLLVILAIAAAIVFGLIGMYNSLVRLRNQVQESWHQVDVELQRRYDLIPNLVETVKAYAGHERNTLEEVVRLRNQAATMGQGSGLPTAERAQVEQQLSTAVSKLLVTVEAYPDLKANANFVELQKALTETEDRIAAGRRFYNANVRAYNTKLESFPTNIIAGMGRFEKATYFEVSDREVRSAQRVDFGTMSMSGPTQSQLTAQQSAPALGQSFQQYPGMASPVPVAGTDVPPPPTAAAFNDPAQGQQAIFAGTESGQSGQHLNAVPQYGQAQSGGSVPGQPLPGEYGSAEAPGAPLTDPYGKPVDPNRPYGS